MKVFISWSGNLSQQVAISLKEFIETCIQTVNAFVSSEDIEKGQRWNEILTAELEKSNFGVICLTQENIQAPWINFEAGALSKHLNSKVSAFVINTSLANIQGPLKSFQATLFDEKNLFDLLISINKSLPAPVPETGIKRCFDKFWPDFSNAVQNHITASEKTVLTRKKPEFNMQGAIEEMLLMLRNMNNINIKPAEELLTYYNSWKKSSRKGQCDNCNIIITNIEKHHIVPLKEGGADSPENIIYLCPTCHLMLHNNKYRDERLNALKQVALARYTKLRD